mmetsp:Transcript_47299/g.119120  ORF Transcript_47299/g.119120 Transcript_47299/m.119120 type:complete len:221 (-) Transcript_47299:51-713(-)
MCFHLKLTLCRLCQEESCQCLETSDQFGHSDSSVQGIWKERLNTDDLDSDRVGKVLQTGRSEHLKEVLAEQLLGKSSLPEGLGFWQITKKHVKEGHCFVVVRSLRWCTEGSHARTQAFANEVLAHTSNHLLKEHTTDLFAAATMSNHAQEAEIYTLTMKQLGEALMSEVVRGCLLCEREYQTRNVYLHEATGQRGHKSVLLTITETAEGIARDRLLRLCY